MNNEALKSKTGPGDGWGTPQDLFDEIAKLFLPGLGLVFDPCPNINRILSGTHCYNGFDATEDWHGKVGKRGSFINPPFSNIAPFILPAFEAASSEIPTVMLVPSRTDTPWWHTAMTLGKVIHIRGRVKYVDPISGLVGGAPSFASSLLLFGQEMGIESWWPECHKRGKNAS